MIMSCSVIRTTFGVLTKIERTLFAMEKAEEQAGKETPVLVHTDLTVVDEDLRVLASSYRHTVNGNWQRTALHWELAQNTVTGCTAMYNRALGDLLQDEPSFFVMHDWWLALTASAFGLLFRWTRQQSCTGSMETMLLAQSLSVPRVICCAGFLM